MWDKLKALFKSSITILWARVVMLLGIVIGVLQAVDITPLVDPKWVPLYLVAMGIVTELARRRSIVPDESRVPDKSRGT